jgi:hypothetical protein
MAVSDQISVVTEAFEHRTVGPHFINPCCFGEDFASWLSSRLAPLRSADFTLSEPIQEDYGWGLWARKGQDGFWIALSYCGDGPQEEPAEWVVSVTHDSGLNLIKRLFHSPDMQAFSQVRDAVWQAINSNRNITVTS